MEGFEWFEFFSQEELQRWVGTGGLALVSAILFVETGLLVGVFLPGDTLLVAAGFVAATTGAPVLWHLVLAGAAAAIAGDSVGYALGRRAGAALYRRQESFWFRRSHLLRTRAFYQRYGGVTIVLARFLPFARTFAPLVAGIAEMDYRRFLVYNVTGGCLWVASMSLLGFYFGTLPLVERHLGFLVLAVMGVSLVPVALQAWLGRRGKGRRVVHSSP